MPKVGQMQGVPAHIETLKADDERRHPARCRHAYGRGKRRICVNTESSIYNLNCHTAKNCDYYEER